MGKIYKLSWTDWRSSNYVDDVTDFARCIIEYSKYNQYIENIRPHRNIKNIKTNSEDIGKAYLRLHRKGGINGKNL